MNADFPQNEREQPEAKLTALLLGELPADEIPALSKAMEQDPELAALYERLKTTIQLVRESAAPATEATASSAPLKLSESKREKLLAQFKTVAPKEFQKPHRTLDWLIPALVGTAAAMVIAALLLPALSGAKSKSRSTSKKNAIINNLRLLDGAEQQWALENNKSGDAKPTMDQVAVYLGRGGEAEPPSIPGGKFVTGKVSESPAVEMNVGDADKVFGKDLVAKAPVHDGKVVISLDLATAPPELNQQGGEIGGGLAMSESYVRAVPPAQKPAPAAPPESKTEIVLPSAGGGGAGDNRFISRYPYLAPGQTVDIAAVHSAGTTVAANSASVPIAYAHNADISGALKQLETNGVAFDDNKVPVLGDLPSMGASFQSGTTRAEIDTLRKLTTNGMVAFGGTTPMSSDPGWSGVLEESRGTQEVSQFSPTTGEPIVPTTPSSDDASVAETTNAFGPTSAHVSKEAAAEYLAANEDLEREQRLREVLALRTKQEDIDKALPRARMVTIMDPAVAPDPAKASLGQKIRRAFSGKVESTARIRVDQEHPDIAGVGETPYGIGYDPYFLLTEFQTIQSPAVLSNVVAAMDLKDKWGKKYNGGQPMSEQEVERMLKSRLDLKPVRNTKLIEIDAYSDNGQEAADLANQVAQSYRQFRLDEYDALKNGGIKNIEEELAAQDQQVKRAQAKVDDLRRSLGVDAATANALSGASLMTADRLKELEGMQVREDAEYKSQKALLEKLKSMNRDELHKTLPTFANDTQLTELLSELDLAEQALIKLKTDYNPDHPKYKNAQRLVDDLNRKVDERVSGIMTGLETQVAAGKASVDTLDKEIQAGKKVDDDNVPERKILVPPPMPQPEIQTLSNAFSTFSLNVSDVSFKLAAASLEKGHMPEPASIRSEEFINAFDYRDPDAPPGVPIAFASERAAYPFAHNRELLRFSLKTAAAGRQAGRPLNIVLLLDNSGSMERADRVNIIREALRVLAAQLKPSDTFSIVTFARTPRLRVDGVPGSQAAAAAAEIAKLTPEGGTNLGDALDLAYETALHHYLANGDNRVVLLTDGAANLGDVNPDSLQQKVETHRKQGIALDCFGIGWEDYNDDLLEVLTRHGDGRYGFINTPDEANTTFVSQIAGALHVAAADVKVQVEFNPKRVTCYRQIGYAQHQLTKEQFRDNTVDAAEIAAQEAGNALYTIEINPQGEGSIATVRVRYKVPDTGEIREQAWDVPYTGSAAPLDKASPAMRLAATASAFSEWLATSPFAADVSTDALLNYLNGVPQVYGADRRPAKLEWMIRQAKSISGK